MLPTSSVRFTTEQSTVKASLFVKCIYICELTEHFFHNSRTHNFDRDTKITIIEEIKQHEMHIERKKEILRTREVFWQKKLMTLQPNGLNKRMGQTKKPLYSFAYVNDVFEHKL